MSSDNTLIEIRDLSRDYRTGGFLRSGPVTHALRGVSLTINRGEIFCVVGESGCGKSTLARLVAVLDQPTSGTVVFEGEDLFALSDRELMRRRREFQMVFQDRFGSRDPRQTVGRIVAEPLHLLEHGPDRSARRDRKGQVAAMLASVGLEPEHADRYPHAFSGGQRQRIAIARALITAPKLVIADEPVSALDLSVQAQVLNLIMDLRDDRNVAFLFITHNLAVVDAIADRVGVMYQGRFVEVGPAVEVLDRPLHPYTRRLADAEPSVTRFGRPAKIDTGVAMPGPHDGDAGCPFRHQCPLAIDRCRVDRPLLTEITPGHLSACHRAGEILSGEAGC